MKRMAIFLFVSQLLFLASSYSLNNEHYSYRGIRISWTDPRQFYYDDSIFINRHLIDSILKGICKKHENLNDTVLIPIGCQSLSRNRYDEIFILTLANMFVKDSDLSIPFHLHTQKLGGYISKGDIYKLYESFSNVPYIDAVDIIDVINLSKKYEISNRYLNCNMDLFLWFDISTNDFEAIDCRLANISGKYKYGNFDNPPCPEAYSIANDSTLTIEERIENLTCMIEDVVKSYIHDFPDIEQNKIILDWKRDIDSLRSLPICRN